MLDSVPRLSLRVMPRRAKKPGNRDRQAQLGQGNAQCLACCPCAPPIEPGYPPLAPRSGATGRRRLGAWTQSCPSLAAAVPSGSPTRPNAKRRRCRDDILGYRRQTSTAAISACCSTRRALISCHLNLMRFIIRVRKWARRQSNRPVPDYLQRRMAPGACCCGLHVQCSGERRWRLSAKGRVRPLLVAVFAPDLASIKSPMICSSVNLGRFQIQTLIDRGENPRVQVIVNK